MIKTHTLISKAKINFRLKVTGLRDDGYHLLSMLNATTSLYDTVKITFSDENSWSIGNISFGSYIPDSQRIELDSVLRNEKKSLILKACNQFCAKFNVKVGGVIDINKEIPSGAGLGGGSSNAASILNFLYENCLENHDDESDVKFDDKSAGKSKEKLNQLALNLALDLGADVPFLIRGGVATVSGIGERVTPLSKETQSLFNGIECIIIFPNTHLSTKDVFSVFRKERLELTPKRPESQSDDDVPLRDFQQHEFQTVEQITVSLKNVIDNDLTLSAIKICPLIGDLLANLSEIMGVYPFMTGSGSSIAIVPATGPKFDFVQREGIKRALFAHKINHFDGKLQVD